MYINNQRLQAEQWMTKYYVRFESIYTKNLETNIYHQIYSSTLRVICGRMHELPTCFHLVVKEPVPPKVLCTSRCIFHM